MNVLSQLQQATAQQHQQLEQAPRMQKLMSPQVSLEDVWQVWCCHYQILTALEPHLLNLAPQVYQASLPLLERDMTNQSRHFPPQRILTPLTDNALWGALYVIGGSQLGGQLIARHLQHHLALQSHFFARASTTNNWSQIRHLLQQQLSTPHQLTLACEGAQQVFSWFYQQLQHN